MENPLLYALFLVSAKLHKGIMQKVKVAANYTSVFQRVTLPEDISRLKE